MSYKTFLLHEAPGHEGSLQRIGKALTELRDRHPVYFHYAYSKEISPEVTVYTWIGVPSGIEVEVVDDFALGLRYMTMELTPEEVASAVAEELASVLSFVTELELRSELRSNPEDPDAIVRLGLASNELNPEALDIVSHALRSGKEVVRRAAAKSAGLMAQPQLLPALEAAASTETDPVIIQILKYAVARCHHKSNAD